MADILAFSLPGIPGKPVPDPIGNNAPADLPKVGAGLFNSNQTIGQMITAFTPYIFAFAGIVLFVLFVSAGFTLLTAVGNKDKMQKGKSMMTSTIVGFVIIFLAYWIMQLLELIFGINLGFGAVKLSNP